MFLMMLYFMMTGDKEEKMFRMFQTPPCYDTDSDIVDNILMSSYMLGDVDGI